MADQSKLIFVNAVGDFEESSSADSLKYTSFKTANFELTDALLGKLVNAINVSTGAPDAAKFILTDAGGKIDNSFLSISTIDHGNLLASSLLDDDHTQYILVDGTRAFTGNQSLGGFKITSLAEGTAGTDAVNKNQLDAAVSGLQDFRESVIDKDLLTPPGSPSTGDRYLVGQPTDTATGAWVGLEGRIVEYNGTVWAEDGDGTPDEGTYVFVEDEDSAYIFNSDTFATGSWVVFSSGATSASLGVQKVGNDFRANLLASGGLKLVGNSIKVEPNDFAGTGLQDDGSDNLEIDFADTGTEMGNQQAVAAADLSANGTDQGAKIIGGDPTNIDFSTSTTVQGILEDIAGAITNGGVTYTVDTGGVTKGDLVYVSSNDSVKFLPLTGNDGIGIGLALTTEVATGTVVVLENDKILEGVLSSATAGDRYYWDGTQLTNVIPTTGGARVYRVGVAKNSADLHIQIEFVKKNS